MADALEWILQNKFCLPAILHYLDDYLNVCADSLSLATQQLDIILSVFRYLGIPLAEEKTQGPSQVLAFSGHPPGHYPLRGEATPRQAR